jgi:3-oxoacyl-[acyl-carrier-protein] synthase II
VSNRNGHASIAYASRPHDPTSTGVVAGEAAASLVLESESFARQRGREPLAFVSGMAARFVASPWMRSEIATSQLRGSCEAIRLAIIGAIENAGLRADDISLVISQAMGDSSIDSAERSALALTLKDVPAVAPVASIGHTGAAIGSVNLVTGLLSLVHRMIPPTLNAEAAAPDARLLSKPQPLVGNHVLCLSHTSEGNAIAVILSTP